MSSRKFNRLLAQTPVSSLCASVFLMLMTFFVPLYAANSSRLNASEAEKEAINAKASFSKLNQAQKIKLELMISDAIQNVVDNQHRLEGQAQIIKIRGVKIEPRVEGLVLMIDLSKDYVPANFGGIEMEGAIDEINATAFDALKNTMPIAATEIVFDGKDIYSYFPEEREFMKRQRNGMSTKDSVTATDSVPKVVVSPGHGIYYHHGYRDWRAQRDPANGITEDFVTQDLRSELAHLVNAFDFWGRYYNPRGSLLVWEHPSSGNPGWKMAARYHLQADYPQNPGIWHSRPSDTSNLREYNEDINSRPLYANHISAAAIIHLHTNAGAVTARGSQVYYHTGRANDLLLGNNILCGMKELIQAQPTYKSFPVETVARGVTNKGENILARMPSVIVEAGFHTNATDAAALKDPAFRKVAMKGVAKGYNLYKQGKTCKAFRVTSVPNSSGAQNTSFQYKIYYEGYPTFPVVATTQIVNCPAGTTCTPGSQTYESDTPSPLNKTFRCGSFASTSTSKWRVFLTDADGVKTAPVEFSVTCTA